MGMAKGIRKMKAELFTGPGLRLWRKWKCLGCGAHRTEDIANRTVAEWEKDTTCHRCK